MACYRVIVGRCQYPAIGRTAIVQKLHLLRTILRAVDREIEPSLNVSEKLRLFLPPLKLPLERYPRRLLVNREWIRSVLGTLRHDSRQCPSLVSPLLSGEALTPGWVLVGPNRTDVSLSRTGERSGPACIRITTDQLKRYERLTLTPPCWTLRATVTVLVTGPGPSGMGHPPQVRVGRGQPGVL